MNDIEYDIIDELYFVTAFPDIAKTLNLSNEVLSQNLQELIKHGYVKAFFPNPDTEIELDEDQYKQNYEQYFFLATKAGLIRHNSR